MRKVLVPCIALMAVVAAPAIAADMPVLYPVDEGPVYAPPGVPQRSLYNWTGFYIGFHAGGVWGDKHWDQTFLEGGGPLDNVSNDPNGWLAGGQLGYNWQWNNWVFGVEGQASWTNADDCGSFDLSPTYHGCSELGWLGSVAGRVGYAFDNVLLYAKGGVAFVDEEHYALDPSGDYATTKVSDTRTGWMLGAGVEWGFWDNWSAKAEYNYMNFGTENYQYTFLPSTTERFDIEQDVHLVKVGINYRFGGPAFNGY